MFTRTRGTLTINKRGRRICYRIRSICASSSIRRTYSSVIVSVPPLEVVEQDGGGRFHVAEVAEPGPPSRAKDPRTLSSLFVQLRSASKIFLCSFSNLLTPLESYLSLSLFRIFHRFTIHFRHRGHDHLLECNMASGYSYPSKLSSHRSFSSGVRNRIIFEAF